MLFHCDMRQPYADDYTHFQLSDLLWSVLERNIVETMSAVLEKTVFFVSKFWKNVIIYVFRNYLPNNQ